MVGHFEAGSPDWGQGVGTRDALKTLSTNFDTTAVVHASTPGDGGIREHLKKQFWGAFCMAP